MSDLKKHSSARDRSNEFLKLSGQFKLGALTTEAPHPVTAGLSEVASRDLAGALDLLFQVDADVVTAYRNFALSGRLERITETVLRTLRAGGRIFFTGCGATGRLSIQLVSIWRDFWQQQGRAGESFSACAPDFEHRALSVMAGGDFALIKSVEGFEDFAAFGGKQLADLGVSNRDVVFAITEGGETSFVIGTAWKGVEVGARVFFVYNNPDSILCEHVQRSREVIEDPRIEKINLTTGPMAITGSTRMQATSIQLCVMLTLLEMVVRHLLLDCGGNRTATPPSRSVSGAAPPGEPSIRDQTSACESALKPSAVPQQFLTALTEVHDTLKSPKVLSQLAKLVALEEAVYRAGRKNNYYADRFGIDVLTDTTERSPTYCTAPFRKFDDTNASESWSFLFLPDATTTAAWRRILKREPNCVEWSESEMRQLTGDEKASRLTEVVRRISRVELMRFRIGRDGMIHRPLTAEDSAIAIVSETEVEELRSPSGFSSVQLDAARACGARTGLIFFGNTRDGAQSIGPRDSTHLPQFDCLVEVPVPRTDLLLDGVTRVGVKMVLNALSTCTMVRMGRVMGNCMIYVVASNLKLVDRATRYIQQLTALDYGEANRLLFEVIEHVEPRMKADMAYPPVVGLAVLRARHGLTNEQAEVEFSDHPHSVLSRR